MPYYFILCKCNVVCLAFLYNMLLMSHLIDKTILSGFNFPLASDRTKMKGLAETLGVVRRLGNSTPNGGASLDASGSIAARRFPSGSN
jgi:hypothetical protein